MKSRPISPTQPDKTGRLQAVIQAELTKGNANEVKVRESLQLLAHMGQINHFYQAEKNGELDHQGIDFLVFPDSDWIIPLQVKSSETGRDDHQRMQGSKIPCVVVPLFVDNIQLAQIVLNALSISIKGLVGLATENKEDPPLRARLAELASV